MQAKKEHLKSLKGRARALDKIGLSNRTPIQILLEDAVEHNESNVIRLQRNFENPAVKEAQKAVEDAATERIDEAPRQISKAANYYNSDDLLNNSWMTSEDINLEAEKLKQHATKRTQVGR